MKKSLLLFLILSLFMGTVSILSPIDVSAEEALVNTVEIDWTSHETLTLEQFIAYQSAVEEEIAIRALEPGFDEVTFRMELDAFLFESIEMPINPLARWTYTGIWVANNIVASGLNIAISIAIGGLVTGGIKALVKKFGSKVAVATLTKAINNKLLWWGIKQYTGITAVIQTVVNFGIDPGTHIAKWLDSKDIRKNNGRVDIA